MSATVRLNRTQPSEDDVRIGTAVRGTTWYDAGALANWLLGRNATRVPAYDPHFTVPAAATRTLRFKAPGHYQAIQLLWEVHGLSLDGTGRAGRLSLAAPTGTSLAERIVGAAGRPEPAELLQLLAAQSKAVGEISLDLKADDYDVAVKHVRCVELPRANLVLGGSDGGVDLQTLLARQPIMNGNAGQSIDALMAAIRQAKDEAKRVSLFQWAVPDESAVVTSGAGPTDFFPLQRPILGRALYRDPATGLLEVTRDVEWQIRAKASDATTTFNVTIETTRGGAGVTLDTIAVPINSNAAFAWFGASNKFKVDVDDLAAVDGRQGGGTLRWDDVKLRYTRTAGVGTLSLSSWSVYEPDP